MPTERGDRWSFLRKVLAQGTMIGLECKDLGYERYSARLDAAARERADEWQGDDGWQPIATAPKDGTHILLWRHFPVGSSISEAWWRDDSRWGGNGWSFPEWSQPTHWLPLPSPPALSIPLADATAEGSVRT